MLRMNGIMMMLAISLSVALFTAPGYGEDVRSYSECDVCPGTIHYGPVEAKKIMGSEGLALIRKKGRSDRATIKVDPDIEIYSLPNIIYIKSLLDESYIQIVTDEENAQRPGLSEDWYPEIYVQSSHSTEIRLEDTVTGAWEKMKKSRIYDWVFGDQNYMDHLDLLGSKISYALGLVAGK